MSADSNHDAKDLQVVLYADGCLEGAEREEFEQRLAADPELRSAVRRAQVIRSLVARLPRRLAPLSYESVLEAADALPSLPLARALRGLPRQSAPEGIFERALAAHRARGVPAAPARILPRRVPLAHVAAAACLFVASSALFAGALPARPTQPKLAHLRFHFEPKGGDRAAAKARAAAADPRADAERAPADRRRR